MNPDRSPAASPPRRRRSPGLTALGLVAAGLCAGLAAAQEMIIASSGDGPGGDAMFISTTPLDLRGLRTPDFLRRDIVLMDEYLRFEEPQRPIIESLHQDYLDALDAAWIELVPAAENHMMAGMFGGPVEFITNGPMGRLIEQDGGGGGWVGDAVDVDIDAGPGGGPVRTMIAISRGDGPPPVIRGGGGDGDGPTEIRLEVAVSGEADGGGPAGDGGVVVAGDGPGVSIEVAADGDGLTPEMIEALQEQIQAQVKALEERLAEGGDPLELLAGEGNDWTPPDPEEMKKQIEAVQEQANTFRYEKERLTREFVANVKINLTEPQLERWPGFERKLNRVKLLPKGQLNGERTDLLQVLEQVAPEASWEQTLNDRLHAYEMALNEALLNRDAAHAASLQEIDAAAQAGDTERWRSVADRFRSLRTAVRDTNLAYAAQLAEAMASRDAALADEFHRAAERAMFPRIHRRTYAERVFDAATDLELDPESRAMADALRAEYDASRARFDQRLREVILKEEPGAYQRTIDMMNRMRNRTPGEPMRFEAPEDPIDAVFEKRRESEKAFVDRLRSLLTPEQAAQLPAAPQRSRFEFSFPARQERSSDDRN